jgi:hypothetical protein
LVVLGGVRRLGIILLGTATFALTLEGHVPKPRFSTEAAVREDILTIDPCAVLGAEKRDDVCDVLRLTQTPQRCRFRNTSECFFAMLAQQLGIYRAWRHGVH